MNIYIYIYVYIQFFALSIIPYSNFFFLYYTDFNVLPPWLSKICHQSIKIHLCSTNFLSPQEENFENILKKNKFDRNMVNNITKNLELLDVNFSVLSKSVFYLPSYPDVRICENYENHCGDYIHNFIGIPTIIPNCSAIKNDIKLYPKEVQTIFR
jgi:hypothetical protein